MSMLLGQIINGSQHDEIKVQSNMIQDGTVLYPIAIQGSTIKGEWNALAPDLPGCVASANTKDEIYSHMITSIINHLHTIIENGEELPEPRRVSELVLNPEYEGMNWDYVEVTKQA